MRKPAWSFTTTPGRYDYPGAADDGGYNEISAVVDHGARDFYRLSYASDLLASGAPPSGASSA